MKKTGQLLKDSREKKNLSLHEIGMSLKINPKTLQAMEDGDMSRLPAKSFLRGFVKSYAIYLKLEANEVLATFQSEVDPTPVSATPLNATPNTVAISESIDIDSAMTHPEYNHALAASREANSSTLKTAQSLSIKSLPSAEQSADSFFTNKFLLSAGGFILVILIVFTAKLVEKYQKERVIDQAQVQQIQTELQPNEVVEKLASPVVEEKLVNETPSEVLKTPDAQNEENKSSLVKKIEIQKEEPKKEVKVVEVKPEIKPVTKPEAKPEPTPIARTTEVIVEALSNVMIKYNLGDGKFNSLELSPEQLHTFKSKTVVELDISDGGSVNLIVNGREKGVPGSSGKPLKLIYPKE